MRINIVLLTGISNLVLSEWSQWLFQRFIHMQKQPLVIASIRGARILIILPPFRWQKGEYVDYRVSGIKSLYQQQPWIRPLHHLMQPMRNNSS